MPLTDGACRSPDAAVASTGDELCSLQRVTSGCCRMWHAFRIGVQSRAKDAVCQEVRSAGKVKRGLAVCKSGRGGSAGQGSKLWFRRGESHREALSTVQRYKAGHRGTTWLDSACCLGKCRPATPLRASHSLSGPPVLIRVSATAAALLLGSRPRRRLLGPAAAAGALGRRLLLWRLLGCGTQGGQLGFKGLLLRRQAGALLLQG